VAKQASVLEHVIFAGFTHQPAISLAEQLIAVLPGKFARVFYSDNGSTSTEVALKMAIQYWWNKSGKDRRSRKKLLAFRNSYHGDTFGAMGVSDRSVFTLAFHDLLFEVVFIDTPDETNLSDSLALIENEGDSIAAFIYEPLVQGAGGLRMYAAQHLDELLKKARGKGIICIADEVMTGFGRTGKLFASEYMEEKPDIICLSKGLTGGALPLGVTACVREIHDAYIQDDRTMTFFHGHSYTANPIACAAALASLQLLLEKNCLQAIERIGAAHINFRKELEDQLLPLRNIRSTGTILAFEMDEGSDGYMNTVGAVIGRTAMEKGLYIRPLGNTVYLMPPYCISEDETAFMYSCLLDSLYRSVGNW
jgi:adenosylmethionine-8-amino-7-oxononanoate aminotransferase